MADARDRPEEDKEEVEEVEGRRSNRESLCAYRGCPGLSAAALRTVTTTGPWKEMVRGRISNLPNGASKHVFES